MANTSGCQAGRPSSSTRLKGHRSRISTATGRPKLRAMDCTAGMANRWGEDTRTRSMPRKAALMEPSRRENASMLATFPIPLPE